MLSAAALSVPTAHTPSTPDWACCRGFQWLDSYFGKQPTLRNAITKSMVGQVTLFPTYTPLFLIYAEMLTSGSMQQALTKVQERLPTLLVTGSVYW